MTDEEMEREIERLRVISMHASDAYFAAKRELDDRREARLSTAQKYERSRAQLRSVQAMQRRIGAEPWDITVSQFRATMGSTS